MAERAGYEPDGTMEDYYGGHVAYLESHDIDLWHENIFIQDDDFTKVEQLSDEAFLREYFFDNYEKSSVGSLELYAYRHDMIAILLPGEGRVDLLNRSEKIYDILMQKYDESDEVMIKPTFIGFEYPLDYISHRQMMRRIDRYVKDNPNVFFKENIILPDANYVRSVSRAKFVESLIDNALENDALSLKFLPAVNSGSGKIMSSEILLRMTDTYRNLQLMPQEFIGIATKTGKIARITDYLINQIGNLYQNHGLTTFKLAGLSSLTLNTDVTYFDDENFLVNTQALVEKYKFPKKFLGFEFNEFDIANHFERVESIFKKIVDMDIVLICDQYTGDYISLERLKSLGFSYVKISRKLIADIALDSAALDRVKALINTIKASKINYSVVGLESRPQLNLLNEIDTNYIAQGYYFYQPIDIDELLDKLKNSITIKF